MNVTKKFLIDQVYAQVNLADTQSKVTKRLVSMIIEDALSTITRLLEEGQGVTLMKFGTFKTIVRSAREGRNPTNGDKLHIPATKTVSFIAGSELKARVKASMKSTDTKASVKSTDTKNTKNKK